MIPKTLRLLVPATLILLFAGTALARQEDLPEVTEDGLHRVHDSRAAIGYAKPGADLSGYRQIQLLDAYVAFKKNWERDQRSSSASSFRISSKDIEEIKNDLAQEFRKVFQEVLDSSGYTVVGRHGSLPDAVAAFRE